MWNHFRRNIFKGLLAIIPVVLSVFAVRLMYVVIDKRVTELVAKMTGYRIPGLGIILVLVILYLIGLIASNVVGKQLFNLIETIFNRIPIIKTTYYIGKQLSHTFSLPESQVFKQVVLVDCWKMNSWMVGFVSGTIQDKNEVLLKVFVPTVPNPTTGFLLMLKESDVRKTSWTVEEGMRIVVSGGIIGPKEIQSPPEKGFFQSKD